MPKITASKTAVKSPHRPRRPRCAPVYRVRNWAAYEAGLKQRGSLTLWAQMAAMTNARSSTPAPPPNKEHPSDP